MDNVIDLPQKNQKRNNEDKVRNTYGKLLIEMCKSNKLLIVNGRIGDNVYGKLTCKGSSTVDYFICDYFIYKYVSNMQVMEHSILFSDVHTPIVLHLNVQNDNNIVPSTPVINFTERIKPWDRSKELLYVQSMDSELISNILTSLDNITPENTTEYSINHIIKQLNMIYIDAAKTTLGTSTGGRKRIPKSNNSKPWFTNACQKARGKFRNSKVYYYRKRTENARKIYKNNEKMYKKILDKEQLLYRNKISKYLSEIQNKNPKEYWKIINRHYKNKSQEKAAIDMDTLYNYFTELNKSPKINEEINEMVEHGIANIQFTNTTTHILNDCITQDEIKRCIKNLKK
jgi:hypothetical protein